MKDDFGILLDLDGVLAQTQTRMLAYARSRFDIAQTTSINDLTEWNLENCIPGLTSEHVRIMLADPAFWCDILPYPGAARFANRLSGYYQVHIVTSRARYPELRRDTESWLAAWGFQYHQLTICAAENKADYALMQGLRFSVEDRSDTAEQLGRVAYSVCLDRPWNRDFAGYRVRSYEEAFHHLVAAEIHLGEEREAVKQTGRYPGRTAAEVAPMAPLLAA